MKSVFITYDQAHQDNVIDALNECSARGYTYFQGVGGRGSVKGEPHLGTHAWPTMNSAIISIVEDEKVDRLLSILHKYDEENPLLGLRAFVWNVEKSV